MAAVAIRLHHVDRRVLLYAVAVMMRAGPHSVWGVEASNTGQEQVASFARSCRRKILAMLST